MQSSAPTAGELYEVHMDVNDSICGAMASLDDIQSDLEEGISCLSSALDEIRDELELCRKAFYKLARRMPSEYLSPCDARKEFWEPSDEELPFTIPASTMQVRTSYPCPVCTKYTRD